ncbi:RAD52 motif-containing protein 1 [Nematostella vectensis]|uniref:RAD52 motif-containing protein 1 n=1 Tax=Nematostella vectensis TaxID=45351 RepID=UPI0020773042|nr:RAD52 motif-containing protein 1 [Nematostella vectensis]
MAAAMAGRVELIEFVRPESNDVNLYITGISKKLDAEQAEIKLRGIFSRFGLIYEVQVVDTLSSENVEGPQFLGGNTGGLYAFVKFYSAKAALRAKEEVNGKWLIDGNILKVQFASRKKPSGVPSPLYMAKCVELAHYYLGFNGWSTSVISITPVPADATHSPQSNPAPSHPMYRCIVRLEIKDSSTYCDGIGYGGDRYVLEKEKDPAKRVELIGIAKKIAHRHALENAFRRVILMVFDNGKVAVEINQMDIMDLEMNCVTENVVHVNVIEEPEHDDDDDDMIAALEDFVNEM